MDHHAYLYEGSPGEFDALKAELRPFVAQKHERFGVDDARALIALAALRPAGEATYLVAASSITTEAQQALLKLLEEPQAGITFVLLLPHGALLPTVRSRLMEWEKPKPPGQKVLGSASPRPDYFAHEVLAFLNAPGKARSDMVAALLKDDEGQKERVLDFVNGLEAACAKLNFAQRPDGRQALEDIAKVRDYLRDRSPSLKMLLEHLALCLPKS